MIRALESQSASSDNITQRQMLIKNPFLPCSLLKFVKFSLTLVTPNDVTCNIWSAFVYIFTEDMSSWELNIGFLQKNCNFTQFSKYTNEKNQFCFKDTSKS